MSIIAQETWFMFKDLSPTSHSINVKRKAVGPDRAQKLPYQHVFFTFPLLFMIASKREKLRYLHQTSNAIV